MTARKAIDRPKATPERDREAFEEWATLDGYSLDFYRSRPGQYLTPSAQHAWESWQAALRYARGRK